MTLRAILAAMAGLTILVTPAQAQKLPPKPAPSQSAIGAVLRGPVDPPRPADPTRQGGSPAPPPPALLASPAPAKPDAGRCRMTCASNYYFCLSNGGTDDCPSSWGQCRAACDSPSPVRPAGQRPPA